jgi:hypothetical protein
MDYSGNILYGKKWCACGDSFTHGDFTGLPESEKYINDGLYQGKYRVYPYLIANRNHMDIVLNAYNGASLAECGRTYDQTFIRGHYRDVPADCDYITLCFGINDWHQNVPLGSPEDEKKDTFYGAWNLVLKELLETHPYAHIGIIATNGTVPAYNAVTRDVAGRWGIPCLDMEQDPAVPLMHRAERKGVSAWVKDFRMKHFIVSEDNHHPNPQAHEYESTFIENFLRSL